MISARHSAAAIAMVAALLAIPLHAIGGQGDEVGSLAGAIAEIDGSRIMATIGDLEAFGTRAFYLDESREAAAYTFSRFSELGLEVEYQNFTFGSHASCNVIATQRGLLDMDVQVLIGAHYDSENSMASSLSLGENLSAPGADDDASGIATTIELATVLHDEQLNYTVKYVAFGAEEAGYDRSGGLKGSIEYVRSEVARNASYIATAILDMIGYRGTAGNHAVLVTNEHNELANAMIAANRTYELGLAMSLVVDPQIRYSDHYPFWISDYPSVLVSEAVDGPDSPYDFNPYYHSPDDTSVVLSDDQMVGVSQALLGGILALNGFYEPSRPDWSAAIVLAIACVGVATIITLYILKVKK